MSAAPVPPAAPPETIAEAAEEVPEAAAAPPPANEAPASTLLAGLPGGNELAKAMSSAKTLSAAELAKRVSDLAGNGLDARAATGPAKVAADGGGGNFFARLGNSLGDRVGAVVAGAPKEPAPDGKPPSPPSRKPSLLSGQWSNLLRSATVAGPAAPPNEQPAKSLNQRAKSSA